MPGLKSGPISEAKTTAVTIRQTRPKAMSIHGTCWRGDPGLKTWATSRALSKLTALVGATEEGAEDDGLGSRDPKPGDEGAPFQSKCKLSKQMQTFKANANCYPIELLGSRLRPGIQRARLGHLSPMQNAIPVAGPKVVLLQVLAVEPDRDGAPAAIGVRLRIVTEGIEVAEVVADGVKRLFLVLPTLGKIGFASGDLAHAFEDGRGDRFGLCLLGADHVNDGPGRLGQLGDILRRNQAGVVGTVGEDDDSFFPGQLGGIFHRQQKAVIEGGVVSGDRAANAPQHLRPVRCE